MAIGNLRSRWRAKLHPRHSTAATPSPSPSPWRSSPDVPDASSITSRATRTAASIATGASRATTTVDEREKIHHREGAGAGVGVGVGVDQTAVPGSSAGIAPDCRLLPNLRGNSDRHGNVNLAAPPTSTSTSTSTSATTFTFTPISPAASPTETKAPAFKTLLFALDDPSPKHDSVSTAEFSRPNTTDLLPPALHAAEDDGNVSPGEQGNNIEIHITTTTTTSSSSGSSPCPRTTTPASSKRPGELTRRQSLLPHQQASLIHTLLGTELPPPSSAANLESFPSNGPATIRANMVSRKIWVKRPAASATLVTIHEDDLVDDVREMILKKYANSLGRNFDAPDVTLRLVSRDTRQEKTLGPEEPMARTLDAYFPGGQTVEEALLIEVPGRRTPKPSPHPQRLYYDEIRPTEAGSDYFPPMPAPAVPSPHLPTHNLPGPANGGHHAALPTHSMSVITTGHVPALPSPGSATRRHHRERPRIGRQHTSSPTIIGGPPPVGNHDKTSAPPPVPPLPPSPAPPPSELASQAPRVATPPPRVSSPRPQRNQPKRPKKAKIDPPSLPAGMLNGGVPPINVLIVEDNIINLKLLEAFMKRLKVRWQTAMNGRDAVTKWRAGGFHLVLMDIQLPIMSGLEATKEIRRLERLNSIGVFSSSASSAAPETGAAEEPQGEDKLPSTVHFKSPVIIVALTASSLQSDRHEALAAGCNDFLTKPVNFVWLERKVMEWGCMQALIDFDGWRKWKDFSQQVDGDKAKLGTTNKKKKQRSSLGSNPAGSTSRLAIQEEAEEGGS
ncbi:hypothetical protein QTJ16_006737 [Diplocarpon rosae]|uniref:Response regulatory domain-containing protein n=1 Tax=Diplocarpon rosae TaxID=946125 RepID=A0AAD9SVV8_9HELO|nr:hypothetical protein QTJ16_006737 [Diplocarpon rosae]